MVVDVSQGRGGWGVDIVSPSPFSSSQSEAMGKKRTFFGNKPQNRRKTKRKKVREGGGAKGSIYFT